MMTNIINKISRDKNKIRSYFVLFLLVFLLLIVPDVCFADKNQSCAGIRQAFHEDCFTCEIVQILISSFITAGAKAYEISKDLGNAVLLVGTILWLAIYVLKSVASLASVEPAKMLQDILTQLFKVLCAFVVINIGIQTILEYTLNPIMIAGTDFGRAILSIHGRESKKKVEEKPTEVPTGLLSHEATNPEVLAQREIARRKASGETIDAKKREEISRKAFRDAENAKASGADVTARYNDDLVNKMRQREQDAELLKALNKQNESH